MTKYIIYQYRSPYRAKHLTHDPPWIGIRVNADGARERCAAPEREELIEILSREPTLLS